MAASDDITSTRAVPIDPAVLDQLRAALALSARLAMGDVGGHDFHGNQWTGGIGGGGGSDLGLRTTSASATKAAATRRENIKALSKQRTAQGRPLLMPTAAEAQRTASRCYAAEGKARAEMRSPFTPASSTLPPDTGRQFGSNAEAQRYVDELVGRYANPPPPEITVSTYVPSLFEDPNTMGKTMVDSEAYLAGRSVSPKFATEISHEIGLNQMTLVHETAHAISVSNARTPADPWGFKAYDHGAAFLDTYQRMLATEMPAFGVAFAQSLNAASSPVAKSWGFAESTPAVMGTVTDGNGVTIVCHGHSPGSPAHAAARQLAERLHFGDTAGHDFHGNQWTGGIGGGGSTGSSRTVGAGMTEVPGHTFYAALSGYVARNPEYAPFLTVHDPTTYATARNFLAEGGHVGGALIDHHDGRVECVSLFSDGSPGAGGRMLEQQKAAGGNYIECFRGHLSDVYAQHGFREIGHLTFDPQYAPPGWQDHPALSLRPDVVQMQLPQ